MLRWPMLALAAVACAPPPANRAVTVAPDAAAAEVASDRPVDRPSVAEDASAPPAPEAGPATGRDAGAAVDLPVPAPTPDAPADRAAPVPDAAAELPRAPDAAPDLPPDLPRDLPPDATPSASCPAPLPADQLISDFAAGSLEVKAIAGRGPTTWGIITDGSGGAATVTAVDLPVPRCDSKGALKFAGGNFTAWGAIVEGLFRPDHQLYDASAYAGVRFFLRSPQAMRVRLKIPDRNTFRGLGCVKCDDHFGADMDVTAEWKMFSYRWADLKQAGSGDPHPAITPSALVGLEFVAPRNTAFELWIDDAAFLK